MYREITQTINLNGRDSDDSTVSVDGEIEVRATDIANDSDDVAADVHELLSALSAAIDETLEDWREGDP